MHKKMDPKDAHSNQDLTDVCQVLIWKYDYLRLRIEFVGVTRKIARLEFRRSQNRQKGGGWVIKLIGK